MSFKMTCFIQATILTALTACVPTYKPDGRYSGSSRLSSLSVKLPAIDSLVAADGTKPVNGLRLSISPADPTCPGATSLDQTLSIQTLVTIQEKIRKGCDYDVLAELGKLDDSVEPLKLVEVYYSPAKPSRVTAQMTNNDKIPLAISLAITDAGKRIGLPEKQPGTTPADSFQDSTTPPSPPTPAVDDLPSNLQVNLTNAAGDVPLKSIFQKKYLLVDFSRPGCGACISVAQSLEYNTTFKQLFSDQSQCSNLSVIPPNQLSDWQRVVGENSWSAKHAYEYSGSHARFAQLFGETITGTPSFILVDRTGKVIKRATGTIPGGLNSLCQ